MLILSTSQPLTQSTSAQDRIRRRHPPKKINHSLGHADTNPLVPLSTKEVLGIRPSPDGDEQLFFEILEGTADNRTFAGEDGRKRAFGNLAERLRRKLGQEAYDKLHLSLYELPPDYFLAMRALDDQREKLTFATAVGEISNDDFRTVDEAVEAARIHYVSREP